MTQLKSIKVPAFAALQPLSTPFDDSKLVVSNRPSYQQVGITSFWVHILVSRGFLVSRRPQIRVAVHAYICRHVHCPHPRIRQTTTPYPPERIWSCALCTLYSIRIGNRVLGCDGCFNQLPSIRETFIKGIHSYYRVPSSLRSILRFQSHVKGQA